MARHGDRPWQRWYGLAAWRKRRSAHLMEHPLCVECAAAGIDEAATVADHITPHRGDWELFIAGPLQGLCASCHSAVKQRAEQMERREAALGLAESSRPIAP